ncbi:hypothetical protein IG631_17597 [Alternaria alternata]|nr:hypothetical protein IG631_17597 [Alternaria alternata]
MSAGKTNFADDMLNAQITDEAELQHKYGEDIPSYDTEALACMGARGSTSILPHSPRDRNLWRKLPPKRCCRDSVKRH